MCWPKIANEHVVSGDPNSSDEDVSRDPYMTEEGYRCFREFVASLIKPAFPDLPRTPQLEEKRESPPESRVIETKIGMPALRPARISKEEAFRKFLAG